MKKVVLLILAALPLAAQASSQKTGPLTLGEMVKRCDSHDQFFVVMCGEYFTGFLEGFVATRSHIMFTVTDRKEPSAVIIRDLHTCLGPGGFEEETGMCIPESWTVDFLAAVVVQYGREHPAELNKPLYGDTVFKILRKAFPCGKK